MQKIKNKIKVISECFIVLIQPSFCLEFDLAILEPLASEVLPALLGVAKVDLLLGIKK